MIAGRLTYLVELFAPNVLINEYGNEATSWISQGVKHAERVSFSGRRMNEVGEHFPDHSVRYNSRMQHQVGENWRLKEGGVLYTIVAIEPNRRRGYNCLICERVNE